MKRILGILILALIANCALAQTTIDGIKFMMDKKEAIKLLEDRFGRPTTIEDNRLVYKNISIDSESYNTAHFFFDSKDRLNLIRLKTELQNNKKTSERMNYLWKKYGATYKTTESFDPEDGRFIVGYDHNGRRLFTISAYKNSCDLSFGPF